MIKNKDIAFDTIEQIDAFNDKLLREHVNYCYKHSAYYRRLFDKLNITPATIKSKADLSQLPLTTKEDIEANHADFLAVPENKIVDLCQTSGTISQPLNLLQTEDDLQRLAYNEEISFRAMGMTANDRVLICCAIGRCFMAGLAYFQGVRQIGAMAIRLGSANPEMLTQAIVSHKPTIIIGVPSQIAIAAEIIDNATKPNLKAIIAIGEPIRKPDFAYSALGQKLADQYNCNIYGTYASTEMATAFTDCQGLAGGHFQPELITTEIIDQDGNPVDPGVDGEIIATPLQVKGMPLLRYCTGDIASFHTTQCDCGRNTFRLGPIVGRKQQRIKVKGTTIYPTAIYSLLGDMPEIKNYYIEVFDDYDLSEKINVVVGVNDPQLFAPDTIAKKLAASLRIKLQVSIENYETVLRKTIIPGKRKPTLFFDYRKFEDLS